MIDFSQEYDNYLTLESLTLDRQNNKFIYVISLDKERKIKIGRGHEARVLLSDISVSRIHCIMTVENNQVFIEDNDSKFGTLVLVQTPVIKMTEDRFRKYDELEDDEKEVLDVFRQMKLLADYNKFKLYKYKVEDLINDYEQLKQLRQDIQAKYFSVYDELVNEELIEGELDASIWGITRENKNETWDSELQLMSEIKTNFDIAINMIETGEAEQMIIDDENK